MADGKTVTYQLSSTSINWQYILTVSSETLNFNYLGGTQSYSVTSYRKNNQGIIEPVEWTTQYSTNNGKTWSSTKPGWLTEFTSREREAKLPLPLTLKLLHKPVYPKVYIRQPFCATAEKGSKAVPYNLSNSTGAADVENTANCYVVNAPGTYSFPLVYGNAINNGQVNYAAYTSKASIQGTLNPFINHLGNGITDPYIAKNTDCVPVKAELVWQDARFAGNRH